MAGLAPICASDALRDGGPGVRFELQIGRDLLPAFVVRQGGAVYAYLNRCAHRSVELDWNPGDFFDPEGRFLVCATHGARYDPRTGRCVDGACAGRALKALPVHEAGGRVYLSTNPDEQPKTQVSHI